MAGARMSFPHSEPLISLSGGKHCRLDWSCMTVIEGHFTRGSTPLPLTADLTLTEYINRISCVGIVDARISIHLSTSRISYRCCKIWIRFAESQPLMCPIIISAEICICNVGNALSNIHNKSVLGTDFEPMNIVEREKKRPMTSTDIWFEDMIDSLLRL